MTFVQDPFDGVLCEVTLQTHHTRKPPRGTLVDCWGLTDRDQFILLYSESIEAWHECGVHGGMVTLTESEINTVRHAPGAEPEDALVALARYRLTGETVPPPEFVNEELRK